MEARLHDLLRLLGLRWAPVKLKRALAPYRLGRLLADGRVAVVFVASGRDSRRQDKVVKFPGPLGFCGGKPYDLDLRIETLQEEARVLTACNDVPNLVRIVEDCTDCELPFLVLERLGGSSLEAVLKRNGPLGLPDWLELLADLSAGLEGMHALGECHNDVKPANILLSPEHGWTLIDPCVDELTTAAYYDGQDDDASSGPARDMVALGMTMRQALLGLKSFDPEWVLFRRLERHPELVSLMRRLRRDGRCKVPNSQTVRRTVNRVIAAQGKGVP